MASRRLKPGLVGVPTSVYEAHTELSAMRVVDSQTREMAQLIKTFSCLSSETPFGIPIAAMTGFQCHSGKVASFCFSKQVKVFNLCSAPRCLLSVDLNV